MSDYVFSAEARVALQLRGLSAAGPGLALLRDYFEFKKTGRGLKP